MVYTPQGDHGFQVFAGPYVAVGLGGRQTGVGYETKNQNTTHSDFDYSYPLTYGQSGGYRRLDLGVNVGVGYRVGPLQLQAGYGLGLRNLYRYATPSYNRVAQLTATYFWGK